MKSSLVWVRAAAAAGGALVCLFVSMRLLSANSAPVGDEGKPGPVLPTRAWSEGEPVVGIFSDMLASSRQGAVEVTDTPVVRYRVCKDLTICYISSEAPEP